MDESGRGGETQANREEIGEKRFEVVALRSRMKKLFLHKQHNLYKHTTRDPSIPFPLSSFFLALVSYYLVA